MLTKETINEMVRIIREFDRMRNANNCCDECRAEHFRTCGFYAANEDLADLIQIVDEWSVAHPEEDQQKKVKNEQSNGNNTPEHSNNTLADHVYHLEDCVRETNERLTIFIHDTVDKIREIKEHTAHQDRAIMCDCVHVGDTVGEEPPKRRTRMEAFLELFPNAPIRTDVHVPVVRPCETEKQYRNKDCTHMNCYECMEKYWNLEVEK